MYFWAPSRYRKDWAISIKTLPSLLFDPAKQQKSKKKHVKIKHQFQNSTARPNDMIHTQRLENRVFYILQKTT